MSGPGVGEAQVDEDLGIIRSKLERLAKIPNGEFPFFVVGCGEAKEFGCLLLGRRRLVRGLGCRHSGVE